MPGSGKKTAMNVVATSFLTTKYFLAAEKNGKASVFYEL